MLDGFGDDGVDGEVAFLGGHWGGYACLREVVLGDWAGGFAGVLGLVDLVGRLMIKLVELGLACCR